MQASSDLNRSPDRSNRDDSGESNEFSGKLSEYFSRKLQLRDYGSVIEDEEKPEDEDEEEEEEFSFACTNPDGSPISAEEAFQDGQIRPAFPIFDQSLLFGDGDLSSPRTSTSSLKRIFVEERHAPSLSSSSSSSEAEDLEGAPVGPYCDWRRKTAVEAASTATCKKSNSTGFSKLWRFRDLVRRSHSDGKDAFVFLNSSPPRSAKKSENKAQKEIVGNKVKAASKTTPSAHEMHYVKNRAMREEHKRRSYLPYRQGVVGVGFFTTVNGLTRNVHPF